MNQRSPTAASFYLRKFCELATREGIDVEQMLARYQVADDPAGRIPAQQLGRIVQHICDLTGDESMGIGSRALPRGAFYTMSKLAVIEPTLARALIAGARFMAMLNAPLNLKMLCRDGLVEFRFRLEDKTRDSEHLFTELVLMSWHRLACWLIAKNIPLEQVYFDFDMPTQVEEYGYLFPGEHVFNAPWFGFAINKRYMHEPVSGNHESLRVFMHDNPVELFLQPKMDFSLSADLTRLLQRHSRGGSLPSIDEAASLVHISRRTLIRRLKKEQTSYQTIKDSVRRDQAMLLLANHDLVISDVASEVGFADAAAFSRAFKSWTGSSPSDYRASGAAS